MGALNRVATSSKFQYCKKTVKHCTKLKENRKIP